MKYQDYAFTLRKTSIKRIKATEENYKEHMRRIFTSRDLRIIDYGFEYEGGLHCHGIVELKEPYIVKQNKLRIRGWRLHLVPLYDQKGWVSYYNKSQSKQIDDYIENELSARVYPDCPPTEEDLKSFSDYSESMRGEILDIPHTSMFNTK